MLAVRSNERAAAAAGINVRNTKLAGFGIAAFIAGMAGGLYAYNFGSVSNTRFGALAALALIAFAYFGGVTIVSGAIIAGVGATEARRLLSLTGWDVTRAVAAAVRSGSRSGSRSRSGGRR